MDSELGEVRREGESLVADVRTGEFNHPLNDRTEHFPAFLSKKGQ